MAGLKRYAPYCANMTAGLQSYEELKAQIPEFATLLQDCGKNHVYFANQMELSSFLLKPMQRITKMPLLVKSILKRTETINSDHAALRRAEEMVECVVLDVNAKCGIAEEQLRLRNLKQGLARDLAKVFFFSLFPVPFLTRFDADMCYFLPFSSAFLFLFSSTSVCRSLGPSFSDGFTSRAYPSIAK
jgi:hypothetical protein